MSISHPASPVGSGGPAEGGENAGDVWRRRGDPVFAFLTLVVVVVEAAILAVLVWALLFVSPSKSAGPITLGNILVGAVSMTAVLLAVVTATTVMARSLETRRSQRGDASVAAWKEIWLQGPYAPGRFGDVAFSGEAVEALLGLCESYESAISSAAIENVRRSGIDRLLLRQLDIVVAASERRTPFRKRSGQLGAQMDVLNDIARARLPDAVPKLVILIDDNPSPAVRMMALRAAARSVALVSPEASGAFSALEEPLRRSCLARGELDETILLMEQAAEPFVSSVLAHPDGPTNLIASCLDSIGRLRMASLGSALSPRLGSDQPIEVRAAAFRALASFDVLPAGTRNELRAALSDREDAVRIHAARAAPLLAADEALPALVFLLGDSSWWVRRAAGEALADMPDGGIDALLDAGLNHGDRYGRDMATQVLRDHGIPVADDHRLERIPA